MTLVCPNCGGSEFEERGDVRCYTPLILTTKRGELRFEADPEKSFSMPLETYDRDDAEAYCLSCEMEVSASELVEKGTECTPTSP